MFLCVCGQYVAATPVLESPDGLGHFGYVLVLLQQHRFPLLSDTVLASARQEATQFPLYYLVAAVLIGRVALANAPAALIPNPFAGTYSPNLAWHQPVTGLPHGMELAVRLLDIFGLCCGVVTVACAVVLARWFFPTRPLLWVATGLSLSALPAFDFAAGTVTNDVLAVALCSVVIVLLVYWTRRGGLRIGWLASPLIALAVLTKVSTVGLVVLFAVAAFAALRTWRERLRAFGVLTASIAMVDGWWFVLSARRFGDPAALSTLTAAHGGRGPGLSAPVLPEIVDGFERFFVRFGSDIIRSPAALAIIVALCLPGLILGALRHAHRRTKVDLLVLSWPAIVMVEIGAYRYASTASGRYLFLAIAPLAAICISGWEVIIRSLRLSWLGPSLVLVGLGTSALCAWMVVRPTYAYPPMLGALPPNAIPLRAEFAGAVDLVGVDAPSSVQPGHTATLTLYWQLKRPVNLPLAEFVHIESLDPSYQPAYDYEGAPGHGMLPPNFWPIGVIIADSHEVRLAPEARTGPRNGNVLTVRTGMYYLPPSGPVRRADTDPPEAADRGFEVIQWKLPSTFPAEQAKPVAQFVNGMRLVTASAALTDGGLAVDLRWQAVHALDGDYTTTVQVL
ncbi:MAG TPA: hypothetical protein VFS62_17090, partial [Chloroflexota bacterium]|nr:hypothetical protein [Chloroflexota bacterium]